MLFNPFTESFSWYTTVDKQIAHPDYFENVDLINGDLMILRLSEPATGVVPVQLNSDPNFPEPEEDLTHATGFGLTQFNGMISDELQVGYFNAISNANCLRRGRFVNVVISSDVMCVDPATDDSVCGGDSGGPLTVPLVQASEQQGAGDLVGEVSGSSPSAVQVGIISFGTDCTADAIPDGMTRVSYYYDWIMEQICRNSRNPPSDCPAEFFSTSPEEAFISQDAAEIKLDFHHDFLAEQTTFDVRGIRTDDIEYVGPEYVPRRGDQVTSTFRLFPGAYLFEVHDVGGDGLRNPTYVSADYPQGSWTISAVYSNGAVVELATGNEDFEYLQRTPFTVPDMAPPIDASLTAAPTTPPTNTVTTIFPTESPSPGATSGTSEVSSLAPVANDVGDTLLPADSNTTDDGDGVIDNLIGESDDDDSSSDTGVVLGSRWTWSILSCAGLLMLR
ncbi:MAG: hypothetical protein SGILL_001057 [Bacillariaceae sp.]